MATSVLVRPYDAGPCGFERSQVVIRLEIREHIC